MAGDGITLAWIDIEGIDFFISLRSQQGTAILSMPSPVSDVRVAWSGKYRNELQVLLGMKKRTVARELSASGNAKAKNRIMIRNKRGEVGEA